MALRPISETQIWDEIIAAEARMSFPQRRFWEAIRIMPEKWMRHPYGDAGSGFWVVGIIGRVVVWFNDIEHGFNTSRYEPFGRIINYWCNQDDLDVCLWSPLRSLLKDLSVTAEQ